ncbi:MAG: stage 0 sporulation protein [Clostridia bacterium]|nr:stage 0 sporulation protein [Clostridia bacterium]
MQNVTGVKFKNSGKIYTFLTNGLTLEVGDNVVVETSAGLSFGQVAFASREIDENQAAEPLKPILRKATEKDIKNFEELQTKALKDLVFVKEKVKQLNLDMKIVSAEYLLDGSKIVIEFSAEDRVDFRELLKELASELKVRIELHQVGQRDEVKIKGGIGPCGEICCCSRFLNDFEHVTVKMAKTQGLSLNPTKISGLCGRLMCCLAYENKTYEEILAKMPKINGRISTPKGNGVVVYNDILRERVSVKVLTGEDSYTIYDFALEELGANNKSKEEKQSNRNENDKNENINVKNDENKSENLQNSNQNGQNKQSESENQKDIKTENQQNNKQFNKNHNGFKKHKKFNHSHKNSKENTNK